MSKQMPESLKGKWDIAQRINEPLNDKRFKWVQKEDGHYELAGIEGQGVIARYDDERTDKFGRGFKLISESGRKVHQENTMNVGVFVRALKPYLLAALEPAPTKAEA